MFRHLVCWLFGHSAITHWFKHGDSLINVCPNCRLVIGRFIHPDKLTPDLKALFDEVKQKPITPYVQLFNGYPGLGCSTDPFGFHLDNPQVTDDPHERLGWNDPNDKLRPYGQM